MYRELKENRPHGTKAYPYTQYFIHKPKKAFHIPVHWHDEVEIIYVKKGNITIYINSHSPMFIEAMDTYSEYYDFDNYVNYYLSEKLENDETKAIFKKIPNNELYKIYDNLGDPFDYLDKVRLAKAKKGVEDDFNI